MRLEVTVENDDGRFLTLADLSAELLALARARGVDVLMLHAINPHGFSHLRRGNEDNVDLNRNFIDWTAPPPGNAAYADLHPALVVPALEGPERNAADDALAELARERSYCRPQLAGEPVLDIRDGRHLVVEQALKRNNQSAFIANSLVLKVDFIRLILTVKLNKNTKNRNGKNL